MGEQNMCTAPQPLPVLGGKIKAQDTHQELQTKTEERVRSLQPPQSPLTLADLCTAFSTFLQPGGADNSTWGALEVAKKILLMLKGPLGAAG